jgi:hypothetical protein
LFDVTVIRIDIKSISRHSSVVFAASRCGVIQVTVYQGDKWFLQLVYKSQKRISR